MEDAIESVGSFGKFQLKVLCVVGSVSALSSAVFFATIFLAAEPDLICSRRTNLNTSVFGINGIYYAEGAGGNASDIRLTKNQTIAAVETVDNCVIWDKLIANVSRDNGKFNAIQRSEDYECYFDKTYYVIY